MDITNNTWSFPVNIEFEEVAQYSRMFEELSHNDAITFDLSDTKNIHSSFIGFLIYAKHKLEDGQGELHLTISPSLKKIFTMFKLEEYLPHTCIAKSINL